MEPVSYRQNVSSEHVAKILYVSRSKIHFSTLHITNAWEPVVGFEICYIRHFDGFQALGQKIIRLFGNML